MSLRAAISSLGTRITFLVLAWLMLARGARLLDVAIVTGAQVLSYLVFRQVAQRLRPVTAIADLLSVVVLASTAFFLSHHVAVLASLAAAISLTRAFGDRYPGVPPSLEEKPSRHTLNRILLFVAGAAIGAAAMWYGAVGALWANAMIFAVAAALGAFELPPPTPEAPLSTFEGRIVLDGETLELPTIDSAPGTVYTSKSRPQNGKQTRLWADPLVRGLAVTLFFTNLFAQAGAVLLGVLWVQRARAPPSCSGLSRQRSSSACWARDSPSPV